MIKLILQKAPFNVIPNPAPEFPAPAAIMDATNPNNDLERWRNMSSPSSTT